jgi:oligoribonuclease NrnB/cAMP/cGMP phosphodiesterase (DHH superfamily)
MRKNKFLIMLESELVGNTVIVHHNDMDGFASAWIAKKALGDNIPCISIDYKQPMPEIPNDCILYVLDFCFPREEMLNLKERCSDVIVIDHHISHKDTLDGTGIKHIFNIDDSGASLTWKYFFPNDEMPDWIKVVRAADIWKWEDYPNSKDIANFFYTKPLTHEFVDEISQMDLDKLKHTGTVLSNYKSTLVAMAEKYKYVMKIDEFDVLAVNTAHLTSDVGNYLFVNRGECAFGCTYAFQEGNIKFSLRSLGDVDVRKVAERFGGGGHKNAAGFSIPFDRFNFLQVKSA